MIIYIVVRRGGQYSDAYHMNETVFIDKAEAEAYIEKEIKQLNLLSNFKFQYLTPPPNRQAIEASIPSNTPNSSLVKNQAWAKAFNVYLESLKIEQLKQFKEYCKNQGIIPEEKMLRKLNPYGNQYQETTDLDIEEVEIKPTSKLYQLLNEERIPWKT